MTTAILDAKSQDFDVEDVEYLRHGDKPLLARIYTPRGEGPFPAVIWNHGSEKLPGSRPELARFYTSHGFVFFVPHRQGQGRSPGENV